MKNSKHVCMYACIYVSESLTQLVIFNGFRGKKTKKQYDEEDDESAASNESYVL